MFTCYLISTENTVTALSFKNHDELIAFIEKEICDGQPRAQCEYCPHGKSHNAMWMDRLPVRYIAEEGMLKERSQKLNPIASKLFKKFPVRGPVIMSGQVDNTGLTLINQRNLLRRIQIYARSMRAPLLFIDNDPFDLEAQPAKRPRPTDNDVDATCAQEHTMCVVDTVDGDVVVS